MSGIIDTVGSKSGIVGSDVYPAGHVVMTSKTHAVASSHVSTTQTSTPEASGILISTPATTGSNYNIITFSAGNYHSGGDVGKYYLYVNKNSAGYAITGAGIRRQFAAADYDSHAFTWVDTVGLSSGTNIYQIYIATGGSTWYAVHNGHYYSLIVQEIQV